MTPVQSDWLEPRRCANTFEARLFVAQKAKNHPDGGFSESAPPLRADPAILLFRQHAEFVQVRGTVAQSNAVNKGNLSSDFIPKLRRYIGPHGSD